MSRISVRFVARLTAGLLAGGSAAAFGMSGPVPALACTTLPSLAKVPVSVSGSECGEDLALGHVAYAVAAAAVAAINSRAALGVAAGGPACNAFTALAILTPFTDTDGLESTPETAAADGAGECVAPLAAGGSGTVCTTIYYGNSTNYLSGGSGATPPRCGPLVIVDGVGAGTSGAVIAGPWPYGSAEDHSVLWSITTVTWSSYAPWAAQSNFMSGDQVACGASSNPNIQNSCV
jgi:hypothetical protein